MSEDTPEKATEAPDSVVGDTEEMAGIPSLDDGDQPTVSNERQKSTTVGTGSYVAISCTVMALLLTFGILGVLLVLRALGWA